MTAALTYVGHSTLLLEVGGARLLTDPVLGPGIGHIRRQVGVPRVEALLPLDAVLVSHAHHDHLDPRSLRRVARDCPVLAPRGCGGAPTPQRRAGGGRGRGRRPRHVGRRLDRGGAGSARRAPVSRRSARGCARLPGGGPTRIYFAGDTDLHPGMAALTRPCRRRGAAGLGLGPAGPARSPRPRARGAGGRRDRPARSRSDPLGNARRHRLPAGPGSARPTAGVRPLGGQARASDRRANPHAR